MVEAFARRRHWVIGEEVVLQVVVLLDVVAPFEQVVVPDADFFVRRDAGVLVGSMVVVSCLLSDCP